MRASRWSGTDQSLRLSEALGRCFLFRRHPSTHILCSYTDDDEMDEDEEDEEEGSSVEAEEEEEEGEGQHPAALGEEVPAYSTGEGGPIEVGPNGYAVSL